LTPKGTRVSGDTKEQIHLPFKPDGSGNTFFCWDHKFTVMLRNEASATDETDASFLSMTAVKKD